jgi:hypothetical protein
MDTAGIVVLVIVVVAAVVLVHAWALMVVWGGIAAVYGLPTLGYGTAILFTFLISLVFGGSSAANRNK